MVVVVVVVVVGVLLAIVAIVILVMAMHNISMMHFSVSRISNSRRIWCIKEYQRTCVY